MTGGHVRPGLALDAVADSIHVGQPLVNPAGIGDTVAGLAADLVHFLAPTCWIRSPVVAAEEAQRDALAERSTLVGAADERLPYAEPES